MDRKSYLVCAIAALLAGAVNGIFGAGGGIVLVIVLEKFLKGDAVKSAISCTLVCMLCMSAVSSVIYLFRGSVSLAEASPYLIPSLIGGAAGGILLKRINSSLLNKLFCALIIFAGVRMIL